MKVNIGTYPNRLVCMIHSRHMERKYGFHWPGQSTRFDNLVEGIESSIQSVYNIANWIWFDRRTQRVKVHIDQWDTWSMDHTLASVVLPMLKQLQETKHGSPCTDDEDVPEELRSTNADPKENDLTSSASTDETVPNASESSSRPSISAFTSSEVSFLDEAIARSYPYCKTKDVK